MYKDLHSRTFVKALIWKVIAAIMAIGITYFYTGHIGESGKVGATTFIVGLILYYAYERGWNHIHWGKIELPPSEKDKDITK
ncbi:MAG TPA: DUF2061 domain-containing protein [Candidatus Binatia bacterium]|nr:DUF2061 domain-containing protein [Candidatus Binatia bacterium]